MTSLSVREVLEEVALDELHERGGVGVDVVRAGEVEGGVAGRADVHHRRHVELDQLLVERVPPAVGERRLLPLAAGRIGVEVAADEAELVDAALELLDAVRRRDARRLRQHADRREVLRVELQTRWIRSFCMRAQYTLIGASPRWCSMRAGARREEGHVGAALALQLELRLLEALADLVVADPQFPGLGRSSRDLPLAPVPQGLRARWCSGRGSRRSSEQLLHRETPRDHLAGGACTRWPPRGCGGSPPRRTDSSRGCRRPPASSSRS